MQTVVGVVRHHWEATRFVAGAPPYEEAHAVLRERYGPIAEGRGFRVGYERGRTRQSPAMASERGA